MEIIQPIHLMLALRRVEKNPNGVMTLNLDFQRKFYSHTAMDLCPDCMKEFQDWMEEVN